MKKIFAVITVLASFALSGCGSSVHLNSDPKGPVVKRNTLAVYSVSLPDGKSVDCIGSVYSSDTIDPDCDWKNIYDSDQAVGEKSNKLQSYVVKVRDGREIICIGSVYTSDVVPPDCNWDSEYKR